MRLARRNPAVSGRSRRVLAGLAGVAVVGIAAGAVAAGISAGGQPAGAGRPGGPHPNAAARIGQARTGALGGSGRGTAQHGSKPARRTTGRLRTSCRSVAHIGDSTSVDLISADFLPDPAQRLQARYAGVGVRHLKLDASGGRSIVEEMPGQVNGYGVATAWRDAGYHGCWVFALGTNDAANVAGGSTIGYPARIDRMMATAHGQPVLWVNTRTLTTTGDWAKANERAWDRALVRALARYPNMRIFDWSAAAKPRWFLSDGIHYNTVGCAMRAKAIADALARAFPLHGHSQAKIVR